MQRPAWALSHREPYTPLRGNPNHYPGHAPGHKGGQFAPKVNALAIYQSSSGWTINEQLRKGTVTPEIQALIEQIDKALTPSTEERVVYRGTGVPVPDVQEWSTPAYLSATDSMDTALEFAGEGDIMRITVPAGTPSARMVDDDLEVPEAETLLARGTVLRITGRERGPRPGITLVHAEVQRASPPAAWIQNGFHVNAVLRGDHDLAADYPLEAGQTVEGIVEQMDAALEKLPTEPLYRGEPDWRGLLGLPHTATPQNAVGHDWTDAGYAATARQPKAAIGYSDGKVLLRITPKPGLQGINMGDLSTDEEVALQRDVHFSVTGTAQGPDGYTYLNVLATPKRATPNPPPS